MNIFKNSFSILFILTFFACDESPKMGVYDYPNSSTSSIQEKKEESNYSEWDGIWIKGKSHEIVTINITNSNEAGFEFSINGSYGGNLGELSGKAMITENGEGFFSSAESGLCELYFVRNKKGILVKSPSQECGAGMGVRYDGQYKISSQKDDSEAELSFTKLGLAKNEGQAKLIENLVGADKDLFLNSSHQTRNLPNDAETGAKVKSSGVAGLYGEMENIILLKGNQIWAAVIDPEKSEIHYFTNVDEWKQKMPPSIKTWAESIPDKTIIYSSNDGKN